MCYKFAVKIFIMASFDISSQQSEIESAISLAINVAESEGDRVPSIESTVFTDNFTIELNSGEITFDGYYDGGDGPKLNLSWKTFDQVRGNIRVKNRLLKKLVEALTTSLSELSDCSVTLVSGTPQSRYIAIEIDGTRIALWTGIETFGDEGISLDINGYPLSTAEEKDTTMQRVKKDIGILSQIYPVVIDELNKLILAEG